MFIVKEVRGGGCSIRCIYTIIIYNMNTPQLIPVTLYIPGMVVFCTLASVVGGRVEFMLYVRYLCCYRFFFSYTNDSELFCSCTCDPSSISSPSPPSPSQS